MQRDWLDLAVDVAQLVGAIGTVVAIGYAAVANRNARRAQTRSRDAQVRERRIDFQLDLLKELGEFNLRASNVSFATNEFTLRARPARSGRDTSCGCRRAMTFFSSAVAMLRPDGL